MTNNKDWMKQVRHTSKGLDCKLNTPVTSPLWTLTRLWPPARSEGTRQWTRIGNQASALLCLPVIVIACQFQASGRLRSGPENHPPSDHRTGGCCHLTFMSAAVYPLFLFSKQYTLDCMIFKFCKRPRIEMIQKAK